MENPIRSSPRCQAGPIGVRAEDGGDAPEPPAARPPGWLVRMPAAFLDARAGGLGHRKGWMLLLLESYCRTRCYCWAGNAELSAAYGCAESTLLELLREMEEDGLIRRIPAGAGRSRRLGIILMQRADPDLPVATEAEVPDLIRRMKAARQERGRARIDAAAPVPDPGKPAARAPENRGLGGRGKPGAELRVVVVKDKGDEKEPDGIEILERQRPGPPTPTPVRTASAPPPVQAPDPPPRPAPPAPTTAPALDPAADLTPGMAAWVAGLDPGRKARLDALSPGMRARLLEPHRRGLNDDPILQAEAYRVLSTAPAAAAAAPILAPATPHELLLTLSGAPPGRAQQAAEMLARDFGTARDRKLWPAFAAVTLAAWRGEFPAELLADAYRQAMGPKAKNRGAVFNHALQGHGWAWR